VGDGRRLAVVDLSVGEDPAQLYVFVNPRVLDRSGRESEVEGCLSIPEVSDRVDRPQTLRVAAHDLDGQPFEFAADGWLARAVSHEIDHLDGVLFIDHLRGLRRERVRRQLRKLVRQQAPEAVFA
jgi:peptide deformylase